MNGLIVVLSNDSTHERTLIQPISWDWLYMSVWYEVLSNGMQVDPTINPIAFAPMKWCIMAKNVSDIVMMRLSKKRLLQHKERSNLLWICMNQNKGECKKFESRHFVQGHLHGPLHKNMVDEERSISFRLAVSTRIEYHALVL